MPGHSACVDEFSVMVCNICARKNDVNPFIVFFTAAYLFFVFFISCFFCFCLFLAWCWGHSVFTPWVSVLVLRPLESLSWSWGPSVSVLVLTPWVSVLVLRPLGLGFGLDTLSLCLGLSLEELSPVPKSQSLFFWMETVGGPRHIILDGAHDSLTL